jgi:hypothetical protein
VTTPSPRASILSQYWPLVAGLLTTALAIGWTLLASLRQTGGHLIYGLDDAYIHLAVARTFAQTGIWGVTPQGFASAVSSPLWVLLLAGTDRIFGVHDGASFAWNLAMSVVLLWVVFAIAQRARMKPAAVCILLVSLGLFTPLSVLVMNGMEHILQSAIDVVFVACGVNTLLEGDRSRATKYSVWFLAPVVTSIRYEGAFLVAIMAALFLMRQRWQDFFIVGALGALPPVVMGIVSVANGGFFLPSSVLIKAQYFGGLSDVHGDGAVVRTVSRVPRLLWSSPALAVLTAGSVALGVRALRAGERWTPQALWNATFAAAVILHLQFAAVGSFRYEAYLIVLGLVAIAVTTVPMHSAGLLMVAAACSLPIAWRAVQATFSTPTAVANIYQQQYQMGRFVHDYYPSATVAVNDIGAVSYFGRGRVLDLVGLADMEIARARMADALEPSVLARRASDQDVELAIVYEGFFAKGLPATWQKVGSWRIPNRVAVAFDTVEFLAVRPASANTLIANLRDFSKQLPQEVEQEGIYVHD